MMIMMTIRYRVGGLGFWVLGGGLWGSGFLVGIFRVQVKLMLEKDLGLERSVFKVQGLGLEKSVIIETI